MSRRFFLKNLSMFMIPMLIPVLILGTLAIVVTGRFLQSDNDRNHYAIFTQMDRTMATALDEMDSLYVSLANAEIVHRLQQILSTQTLTLENLRILSTILEYVKGPANAKPYIESIYLDADNEADQLLTSREGLIRREELPDKDWKEPLAAHMGDRGIWLERRSIQRYSFEPPVQVMTLYKSIYSTVTARPAGMLAVNLNAGYIERQLDALRLAEGQRLLVLGSGGELLYQNRASALAEPGSGAAELMKDSSYAAARYTAANGWTYVILTPRRSLNSVPFTLSSLTVLFVLVSFGLGLLLTMLLTRRNTSYIRDLISLIRHAERSEPLPAISASLKQDEYGYISRSLVKSFIEQIDLKVQLADEKYRLRTAELLALQTQINPHFLFNTLESLYWKTASLSAAGNDATVMLEHLSLLLKYSLTTPGEPVSAEEEIRHARRYVSILGLRNQGGFELLWQYDPEEISGYSLPKLLLQPLIENSIQHGRETEDRLLRIKIKLLEASGKLCIAVVDNGRGMARSELEELRRRIASSDEQYAHIGLANTFRRIELLFGENGSFRVYSKLNWGTAVVIRIPRSEDG
ncbi:sensor histidine kinase [Paenibacillus sp. S150]|uniref:cache domain-containing sensor histidine kinase n=1 Tax=Paenibacillus sp. S150 TaxID=2749826 RepID=UPI001C59327C|nr:sensor histidine kinase [Paenibacillus sp. S150]MBW4082543.1 histidine kinase [Paenibacillus sp. S150]